MFNINQGFSLKSAQFNFERDYFKDLATLKAADLSWFPNYFITNVAGTLYQLDKNSTGDKWTPLVSKSNYSDINSLNTKVSNLKTKVEELEGSSYKHATDRTHASGLYKIATDAAGHVSAVSKVEKKDITDLGIPGQDTDTHWTTGLKVGASSTATANAAATNGSVFLNVMDNTSVRDSHMIIGSGATDVTSDANGRIIITSTDTTYSAATSSAPGLMPAADKKKVDSLPEHIVYDGQMSINNADIEIELFLKTLKDGVYINDGDSLIFDIDHADDTSPGLMSAADYTRLKDVTAGATADSAIDTADITSLLSTKLGV